MNTVPSVGVEASWLRFFTLVVVGDAYKPTGCGGRCSPYWIQDSGFRILAPESSSFPTQNFLV
ncbi:MAG: hypothetical protein AAFY20_07565 [Cyanobacteria bacterium J06639_14]